MLSAAGMRARSAAARWRVMLRVMRRRRQRVRYSGECVMAGEAGKRVAARRYARQRARGARRAARHFCLFALLPPQPTIFTIDTRQCYDTMLIRRYAVFAADATLLRFTPIHAVAIRCRYALPPPMRFFFRRAAGVIIYVDDYCCR